MEIKSVFWGGIVNRKIGMVGSVITLVSVLAFAISMLFASSFVSYLSSFFISWGFVLMISAFASYGKGETKAAGYAALAFSAVYALLACLVYFTQMTTVRLTALEGQLRDILDYSSMGLFFNLDLLGYAFMALATFLISFTIASGKPAQTWLKGLLMVHGVFAITCVLAPILNTFKQASSADGLSGVAVLLFWCLYFVPVCILAYHYFDKYRKPVSSPSH
jgi:hypothetical protein